MLFGVFSLLERGPSAFGYRGLRVLQLRAATRRIAIVRYRYMASEIFD